MTKDVLVGISGLHTMSEDKQQEHDSIESFCEGAYFFKNGKHYVLFEESYEGVSGVTKTTIKWTDQDFLEVSKKGVLNAHMIFEKNRKNRFVYETPFGHMNLGNFTTRFQTDMQEDRIEICVTYILDLEEEILSESEIRIQIRAR